MTLLIIYGSAVLISSSVSQTQTFSSARSKTPLIYSHRPILHQQQVYQFECRESC